MSVNNRDGHKGMQDTMSTRMDRAERPFEGAGAVASRGSDNGDENVDEDNSSDRASPVSTTAPPAFGHRRRSLRINTAANDPASETSSIVPTSARLSIASTTYPTAALRALSLGGASTTAPGPSTTQDPIPTLLDSILQNPGWGSAAQPSETLRLRRNSLYSMRSLAPTLPPYEEYRNHILIPATEAGPSAPRVHNVVGEMGGDEKAQAPSVRHEGEETRSLAGGLGPPPEHDVEGEEGALIAHYSRVVRTIDSRYTAEVARLTNENQKAAEEFDREVARMRNEIDATYRNVLKERDKAVERAREEAASRVEELEKVVRAWKVECQERLEETEVVATETKERLRAEGERQASKARHEVEDVWERRWRDRMALVDEELGRRVEERDREWLAFLSREHAELLPLAQTQMKESAVEHRNT